MKKAGLPALVQLAILTLFTAFLWIGFEVYRAFSKIPSAEVDQKVLQQINPTLDQIELDRLVNRINLSEDEIGDTVLTNPDESSGNPVEIFVIDPEDIDEGFAEELVDEFIEDNQATESGEN